MRVGERERERKVGGTTRQKLIYNIHNVCASSLLRCCVLATLLLLLLLLSHPLLRLLLLIHALNFRAFGGSRAEGQRAASASTSACQAS